MHQTMNYLQKTVRLIDNYVIARLQNRPSTALFWYLPEPARVRTDDDLQNYKHCKTAAPFYPIDYRKKLRYSLVNTEGIIVLPYDSPVGQQVNPEAAFQYALGLHDRFCNVPDATLEKKFFQYADYFVRAQSGEGLWHYHFDWYTATAPWSSALAQARGASVMLRAWLHTREPHYYHAATMAVAKFGVSTQDGGFLHHFTPENCYYFEEYPLIPTGVINGFMAALISLWELQYWINESWLVTLWQQGLAALEKMLPYYSIGWWSLYDRDENTPVANVNSPRYHFLEMEYLKVLSILSSSEIISLEYKNRHRQYKRIISRGRAISQKLVRKILYK